MEIGTSTRIITRVQLGAERKGSEQLADLLAIEEPLEIRLEYGPKDKRTTKALSITMRTPGHDEELAAGFCFTEAVIEGPTQLEGIGHCGPAETQNVIRVKLAEDTEFDWSRLERHFYATSSCGVCGKSSLEALRVPLGENGLKETGFRISKEVLGTIPDQLRKLQSVFEKTGGLHGCGLFLSTGKIELMREDVGRHNALDKVIGRALLDNQLPLSRFGLILSGRASFELIQKAARAGISLVAAVGAPSTLAVDLAQEYGMTLAGFVSRDRFNVYHGENRIN